MYTRITKSGSRRYLQLVEGFRDDRGKVKQRVVASLGRIDQLEADALDPLIKGLQRAVGKAPDPGSPPEFESAQAFGHLWALQQLWASLGFGEALRRSLRSSRRQFDAEALIRAMVFNRLCDPDAKLGVLRWLETVAMPKAPESVTHDQLLRAMDALMDRIEPVEAAVCRQLRPLLDQSLSVVFYDLTTIRIQGEGEVAEDLRRFGRSKDGGVRRQFVLGVVQSAEGLPLMQTVAEGNVAETKTLRPMLERVLAQFPVERMVVVADRGLLSLDNIDQIEAVASSLSRRIDFILAVPIRRYGELADVVIGLDAEDGPAEARYGDHRLIVAHDAESARRQRDRRRARLDELLAAGQKLADKLDRQDAGLTERGRKASDRGAYARFHRMVAEAEMTRFIDIDLAADLFSFSENRQAIERAEALDGKLVLITSVEDLAPDEVVRRYKALADIERGFRVLKSDIEIAPVYHRLPERIRAHALICFLALILHRVMRMRLQAHGAHISPTRALRTLAQIQRHTACINGRAYSGLSRPSAEQMELFGHLEIPRPNNSE